MFAMNVRLASTQAVPYDNTAEISVGFRIPLQGSLTPRASALSVVLCFIPVPVSLFILPVILVISDEVHVEARF